MSFANDHTKFGGLNGPPQQAYLASGGSSRPSHVDDRERVLERMIQDLNSSLRTFSDELRQVPRSATVNIRDPLISFSLYLDTISQQVKESVKNSSGGFDDRSVSRDSPVSVSSLSSYASYSLPPSPQLYDGQFPQSSSYSHSRSTPVSSSSSSGVNNNIRDSKFSSSSAPSPSSSSPSSSSPSASSSSSSAPSSSASSASSARRPQPQPLPQHQAHPLQGLKQPIARASSQSDRRPQQSQQPQQPQQQQQVQQQQQAPYPVFPQGQQKAQHPLMHQQRPGSQYPPFHRSLVSGDFYTDEEEEFSGLGCRPGEEEELFRLFQEEEKKREEQKRLEEELAWKELLAREATCGVCNTLQVNKILFAEKCNHHICYDCLHVHLKRIIASGKCDGGIVCPTAGCGQHLPGWMYTSKIVGSETNEKIEALLLKNVLVGGDYATCPSCSESFVAVPGKAEGGRDEQGQNLTAEAAADLAKNRFRCLKCNTIFCRQCNAQPYHIKYTCEEFKSYKTGPKCRFCAEALDASNTAPQRPGLTRSLRHVCKEAECLAFREASCSKTLPCAHPCRGVKNEAPCLDCLDPSCVKSSDAVTDDTDCVICYSVGLGAAPSIKLQCGHLFHLHCARSRLQKKWTGARIYFNFLACPLCQKDMAHPALLDLLNPMNELKQLVLTKAMERLKIEGLQNDPKLTQPGKYFKNPTSYVMDRFAYYPCFRCKGPYFGGMRQCEDAAAAASDEKFNPEHLVCGSCAAGSDVQTCRTHGKDFIDYKCKFCCGVATWFCWGTTHFCDVCHKKQEKGEYLNRKKVSDLPRCPGPKKCTLSIAHPQPGEEFVLGCSICRPRVAS